MSKSYFIIAAFLLAALLGISFLYGSFPTYSEKSALIMGTTAQVKVHGWGANSLAEAALAEMNRLDKTLSKFERRSEIGLINLLAGKASLQISADTFNVIEMARRVNRLSQGAFDITLGQPGALVLDKNLRRAALEKEGAKLDLGGIGKGYAVESARRLLMNKGVKRAIIDLHSSIAVIGNGWKIGIRHPLDKSKVIGAVILDDGQSLSTSAQYEQAGHLIDPRTGRSADQCQSVTVIGRNAGFMDALSTAVFVLGPEAGMQLIESLPEVEGLIVDQEGNLLRSAGFVLQ